MILKYKHMYHVSLMLISHKNLINLKKSFRKVYFLVPDMDYLFPAFLQLYDTIFKKLAQSLTFYVIM